MQNTKISFIPSFNKIVLIFFVLLLFLFYYRHELTFVTDFVYYAGYLLIIDLLQDYTYTIIALVLLVIYLLKTYVFNYFLFLIYPFNNSKDSTNSNYIYYYINKKRLDAYAIRAYNYIFNVRNSSNKYTNLTSSNFKLKNNLY